MTVVLLYGLLISILILSNNATCDQQVTLSCGNNDNVARLASGAPGKRGAPGSIGPAGPQGPKGEPGASDTWSEAFMELNRTVVELQRKLKILSIRHVKLRPNQVTWNLANEHCERMGSNLCAYSDIFPDNDGVPTITGILSGNHWTPIKDRFNDWAQIGDTTQQHHRPGLIHNLEGDWGPPGWGVVVNNYDFKGHIFCCA